MNTAEQTLYAGSYSPANRPGLYRLSLNTQTGSLTELASVEGIACPAYVALHPNGRWAYVAGETSIGEGTPGSVWAVDISQNTIILINSQPSEGDHPCHVAIDKTGRWVAVSNYSSGNVGILPILPDGSLGEMSALAQHIGSGPMPGRQESPHAHSSIFSPDNRFLMVADLGIDSIMIYSFDSDEGTLTLHNQASSQPGAGPRHMVWHPNGLYFYVANELNASVALYDYNAEDGELRERLALWTLESGDGRGNWTSDIRISPNADRIYVSNRRKDGQDSIAIYAADQEGGLERLSISPSGGNWPRMFAISHGQEFIVIANEESNRISVLPIEGNQERLGNAVATFDLTRVSCVQFVG